MKQVNGTALMIGGLAGIASALLVLAATRNLGASTFMLVLSAIPIFISGMAFGASAVIASVISSFLALSVMQSPEFALGIFAVPVMQSAWLSYLANMARPASELGGPDNVMAWYPLSDMMVQLCGLVALAVAIILLTSGYDQDWVNKLVDMVAMTMAEQNPELALDGASVAMMKKLYFYMLPIAQSGLWVVLIFAAYYFAARIVWMSKQTLRPREDIPASLRMNPKAIFPFLAGMLLVVVGGKVGIVGAAISGAFGGGFLLAGLASLHFRSRGKVWRGPALVFAYLTIFISGFVFVVIGLYDTRRAISLTPKDRTGKTDTNTNTPTE